MDTQLNFINRSNETDNPQIVIFQQNAAAGYEELAVAWLVIQNCGQGDNHPFTYPMSLEVNASDSWGNYTPRQAACNGQLFAMYRTASGDQLQYHGPASSPANIEVLNGLLQGAIGANIYKNGKLLATKASIAPQQKAVFQFKPDIWIGVAKGIVEGQVMNAAILSQINTQISLLGIAAADIVMTGGGAGPNATPFAFALDNIVTA